MEKTTTSSYKTERVDLEVREYVSMADLVGAMERAQDHNRRTEHPEDSVTPYVIDVVEI